MLEIAVRTIAMMAGLALCAAVVVTARRRYGQNGDRKTLLVSLVAAIVALVSGLFAELVVLIHIELPNGSFFGVIADHAFFAYFSSLASLPVGMAWGWAFSFVRNPTDAGQARAADFIVRGLAVCLFATTALVVVDLAARLAWYGYDNTIGPPALAAAFLFLGLMMLLAVAVASNARNVSVAGAVLQVGAGFGSAFMLALSIYIVAAALESYGPGWSRIVERWNILIIFYPFYLGGSLGVAAVLFFYGGRLFARTWSRLSVA